MTNQSSSVVVGGDGHVWVAPTATAAPTNTATALNAAFVDLGYCSEDGATFSDGKETVDIMAWQSFTPIKKLISTRTVTVSFVLRQWSQPTLEFALGGDVVVNAAEFKYTPPAASFIDERSLVLEWFDGDDIFRLYIPKGIVTETVETNIARTAAADLPITFTALDPGAGAKTYTLFTDKSSMAATS